jgi:DNA-directed RNA polymerase subunit alpha
MEKIKTVAYVPEHIEVEEAGENTVNVSIYPFETGYAVTLAHPLRRLLFNSTVGYAPTAVKIEGVNHEFDSLRGMLEDVAMFIINLKNMRFKINSDEDRVEVSYTIEGNREVKGADLTNDIVDVVNKDAYLCTVNEDAKLDFTIIVQKGIGYVPSEEIRDKFPNDFIAIDAFFTPVKRAVYNIEKVLVDDNPNYEKIVFTIETDGQVTPAAALKNSVEAMYAQMSIFNNLLDISGTTKSEAPKSIDGIESLVAKVDVLNLSARSSNCLSRADIEYVGELALMQEAEVRRLKNLGKKSLDEIKSVMADYGYPIDEELPSDIVSVLKEKIDELKANSKEGE